MPMLDDPAAVDRHLREYIDDATIDRLPPAIGLALKAAREKAEAVRRARKMERKRLEREGF